MTVELACALIKRVSVTPEDAGCMTMLTERLARAGFKATPLRFEDTDNLWITHGTGDPVLCLLGHTDVVPPGPLELWHSDPFEPRIQDGYLYGRGAADMKGSIAAMVTAMERFVAAHPDHPGTLALLLTSDEEGRATNGTVKVVEYLQQQKVKIKWCVVGEPSSQYQVGDTVKNGRRGSLTGHLVVHGVQGHVAYPERGENPIHRVMPVLNELCATVWDQGNEFYAPTSFQISNINAGTGADNVIPGTVKIQFNFRFSTQFTDQQLKERVEALLSAHKLRFQLEWLPSSKPFLTASGDLLSVTRKVIEQATGQKTQVSTSGGTSDGRYIAPTGAEVVELGPVNETIHKLNECVKVADLELLSEMYEGIVDGLLVASR